MNTSQREDPRFYVQRAHVEHRDRCRKDLKSLPPAPRWTSWDSGERDMTGCHRFLGSWPLLGVVTGPKPGFPLPITGINTDTATEGEPCAR